ncbi:MAG TPA: NADH-quinone oxidoreductase subunit M [Candidatus Methanomethylophilaceae archaeon]|nr:NADH-quinone oxidoreductase subunit M [Candidatus Methanomethylophilaceae archaeon]
MFENIPILTLLLVIPLIGAMFTLMMGGNKQKYAKYVAGIFSGIVLVLATLLMFEENTAALFEKYLWIDAAGIQISYILQIDGLSKLMVFLTALLVFFVVVFSASEKDKPNYYHALVMIMQLGLMGVYLSADYFLFYIMWEITLIPMYFMISWYGGPRRHYAAIKFFIYTHVASLVMLIGIFALAFQGAAVMGSPVVDFSFAAVQAAAPFYGEVFQTIVFGMLFFGFIVKMPMVPFHTWLPDAHVEAPTGGSVLLAGVMLKMGSYGIIRIALDALPNGAYQWAEVIMVVALISIVYGAYACIAQTDLKKMVAYSSINHMGMVLLGVAASLLYIKYTASPDMAIAAIGIQFAIFQMFAHGLITAVLFMVCGFAGHSLGTREIPLLGGLASKMPYFATFMMIGFMASLGLPGLVGFWGEFGLIFSFYIGAFAMGQTWLIVFCLLSIMLNAGFYIWAMQRVLFGRETTKIELTKVHDVSKAEGFSLAALCILIALFGICPGLALDVIQPFAENFMTVLQGALL